MFTGVGKIFNGVKYDFPIRECIESVTSGAQEFILVVCTDSEDDTVEYCRMLAKKNPKLRLIEDVWRKKHENENYRNMPRLANMAIEQVKTEWFFSVDMDEIMPRRMSQSLARYLHGVPKSVGALMLRFHHLYFDTNHEILGKLYSNIHRVGRVKSGWRSGHDGCGIENGSGGVIQTPLNVCHYGFLREMDVALEKESRFQEELYHDGKPGRIGAVDDKLIAFKDKMPQTKKEFWEAFISPHDCVVEYNGPEQHPLAIERYGR